MDPSLKERLQRAQRQLLEQYDELNAAWKEAESLLLSLHGGRDVAIIICEEDPDEVDHREEEPESSGLIHYLTFSKEAGKWGIYYVAAPNNTNWDNSTAYRDVKPILECCKEDRVMAAEVLPQLVEKVVEEAEKLIVEIERAAVTIKRAVSPL